MRIVLLIVALVAQVALFATVEGTAFEWAGGVGSYYGDYFFTAASRAAPMLLVALGMALTAAVGGADLSLAALAALAAAVLARGGGDVGFWYTAFPVALLLALAAAALNGALIACVRSCLPRLGGTGSLSASANGLLGSRRTGRQAASATLLTHVLSRALRITPLAVTLGAMLLWRFGAWLIAPEGPGPFLTVPGYQQLSTSTTVSILVPLMAYLLVAAALYGLPPGRTLLRGKARERETDGGRARTAPLLLAFGAAAGLALLAAMMETSRHGTAGPRMLLGVELQALLAVLLAGLALRGGRPRPALVGFAALNVAVLLEGLYTLAAMSPAPLPVPLPYVQHTLIALLGLAILLWRWRRGRAASDELTPANG